MERNVVFNDKDVQEKGNQTIILGVQSEGEKDKIIQHPENINEAKNQTEKLDEPQDNEQEESSKTSNPVPLTPDHDPQVEPESESEELQQYGRGHRKRMPKGAYRAINEGLTAAIALSENGQDLDCSLLNYNDNSETLSSSYPPDFALVGNIGDNPRLLDEALRGPDAKRWQEALDYEIGQLEKLDTWDVVDLPSGHNAIPCSEVLKVKRGPDGNVTSYRVRIVAGGHKQVKGINYTITFSAAAKMPTVRVILANTAHQNWKIEHVDIKSAYLNAKLKETIFMKPLRGVL